MLEANTRGAETPDKESLEVLKELGVVTDEETQKEQPEVKSEEPTVKKEEPKKEEKEKELPKDDKTSDHETKPERKSREPKMIPAWQHEIEKNRIEKEHKEEIERLSKDIEILKNKKGETDSEGKKETIQEKIDDKMDKIKSLSEKYGVDEDFMKELVETIRPNTKVEFDEDTKAKLAKIDEYEKERKQKQEDLEYEASFSSKIDSALKEQFPNVSKEEISVIKEKLKDYYFDERYVNLDIDEIYAIKSKELNALISTKVGGGAGEKRGVARDSGVLDYENLTDAQYAKLSPEEQEKVNQYLEQKERDSR